MLKAGDKNTSGSMLNQWVSQFLLKPHGVGATRLPVCFEALKVLFVPLPAGPCSDIHSPKWRKMIWTKKKPKQHSSQIFIKISVYKVPLHSVPCCSVSVDVVFERKLKKHKYYPTFFSDSWLRREKRR